MSCRSAWSEFGDQFVGCSHGGGETASTERVSRQSSNYHAVQTGIDAPALIDAN
jgi:hypothetical protein